MTFLEKIERLFEDEEHLDLIFEELQEELIAVEDYHRQALHYQLDNPYIIDKALCVLQGAHGVFNSVLSIAESEKEKREDGYYMDLKIQTEKEGGKFVDASAKKEASYAVRNYTRVRNLIEAQVRNCAVAINVLQSRLKKTDDATKLNKGE